MIDLQDGIPQVDGRQSETAACLQRGVARLLNAYGLFTISELSLGDGRRADVVGLSKTGEIWIVEIKSSVADFRADGKWQDYLAHCDRFYFAVERDFPVDLLPEDTGLILGDKYGGDIVRDAPCDMLSGARRKAVLIRFARAGAQRLQNIYDPSFGKS